MVGTGVTVGLPGNGMPGNSVGMPGPMVGPGNCVGIGMPGIIVGRGICVGYCPGVRLIGPGYPGCPPGNRGIVGKKPLLPGLDA
jgi:hypothetical protein